MSIANKQENWNHSKIKDLEGEKKPTPTFCRLPPPPPFFNSLIAGEYCFKLKGTEKGGKRVNCVLVEANINWSAEPKKGKISKFPTVWHHSSYWCKTRFLLAEYCDVAVSLTAVVPADWGWATALAAPPCCQEVRMAKLSSQQGRQGVKINRYT